MHESNQEHVPTPSEGITPQGTAPPSAAEQAASLRDAVALPLLRTLTDSLGWRPPVRQDDRERLETNHSARALHKYGSQLAALTVNFKSEARPTLDLRVTCEVSDNEVFNAERIVRIDEAHNDELREWLERQLAGCHTALVRRVPAR
jgi:hypothetical protein